MQLNKVFDPRDALEKARRKELEKFAAVHGVSEIKEGMPAVLMRAILRQRNLTNINIPPRTLGIPDRGRAPAQQIEEAPAREVSAVDDLKRQWEEKRELTTIQELRAECKKRGIKLARTDNIASLKAKLNG